MNKAILLGRLTKDPIIETTPSGIEVCRFTLAVNRYNDEADFFIIIAWRNLANICGKYLEKGKQCIVEGNIQNRSYEKDGIKRYVTEIIASNVHFVGNKQDTEQQEFGQPEPKVKHPQCISDLPDVEDDDGLPW